jgi:hypothetical protein
MADCQNAFSRLTLVLRPAIETECLPTIDLERGFLRRLIGPHPLQPGVASLENASVRNYPTGATQSRRFRDLAHAAPDSGACRLFIAAASITVYDLRQLVTEFVRQLVAAGEIMQGAVARPKWDQEPPDALS